MKNIILLIATVLLSFACSNTSKKEQSENRGDKDISAKNQVEVLYFHGKQRCITCNAIEKLTKEVVDTDFSNQLQNGDLVFKVIDISTPEGRNIADQYEVSWSSLYINKWENGEETKNNMTETGFSYAKNEPDIFKNKIKDKIDELLN